MLGNYTLPLSLSVQVVLQCMVCPGLSSSSSSCNELFEVVLEKRLTVGECCSVMVMSAGLTGVCVCVYSCTSVSVCMFLCVYMYM